MALAILDSVFGRKGFTFSVEIARQGGKNELSAQLELLLLTLYMAEPQNLVKYSPTFKPQTVISLMRLKGRLNNAGFTGIWAAELGYIIKLGNARAIFLSTDESANVVGNTTHILLEIDESQDVSKEKYSKEFKLMRATANVTTVHYGTTWDDSTLLEEIKQANLELERKEGIKSHFRYDWQDVAKYNPDYSAYIEDIAGYGSIIFSVLIGISVVISLDKRVYQAKLEGLVWTLFFTGMSGSILFPVIATTYWIDLGTRGKVAVAFIDGIGLIAVIILICYCIKLLSNKAFRERDMPSYFPEDSSLDAGNPESEHSQEE